MGIYHGLRKPDGDRAVVLLEIALVIHRLTLDVSHQPKKPADGTTNDFTTQASIGGKRATLRYGEFTAS